jgi:hypothetical protein
MVLSRRAQFIGSPIQEALEGFVTAELCFELLPRGILETTKLSGGEPLPQSGAKVVDTEHVSGEKGTPRLPQEVAAPRPPGPFRKRNSQEEVDEEKDLTIPVLDPRAAAATAFHLFAPPALVHDPGFGHDPAARFNAGSQAFKGVAHRTLGSQLGSPGVQEIAGEGDFLLDRERASA